MYNKSEVENLIMITKKGVPVFGIKIAMEYMTELNLSVLGDKFSFNDMWLFNLYNSPHVLRALVSFLFPASLSDACHAD